MARRESTVAKGWWDYTTLDEELMADAAKLTPEQMVQLSRPGFEVRMYDTLEEFYLAEALEYIEAWRQSTDDNPVGICGPIGPTEQRYPQRPFLGHGRMVCRRQRGAGHAPAVV
jgi:glucosamine-6-phosphate deaminase